MANSLLLYLLTVLFSTVRCANLPSGISVFSLISDTKFCASILSPTEDALKKSLESAFINNVKTDTRFDDKDNVDLCCRSFYKCNSFKSIELNYTTTVRNIRHCDCEYFFRTCLNNLNTTLSNEIGFIHTLNTTKCYANDYPIIKCITFDTNLESNVQFSSERFSNRCAKYQLDENKTKRVQLFDLSFHGIASARINGNSSILLTIFFCFCFSFSFLNG